MDPAQSLSNPPLISFDQGSWRFQWLSRLGADMLGVRINVVPINASNHGHLWCEVHYLSRYTYHMHANTHICIYISTYVYSTKESIRSVICIEICICIYIYIHMYMYVYTRVCIYVHTHMAFRIWNARISSRSLARLMHVSLHSPSRGHRVSILPNL